MPGDAGVGAELFYDPRGIKPVGRFNEQVVVVAHEVIGIEPPVLLADFLRQEV